MSVVCYMLTVGTSPYQVRWQVNWTCGAPFFQEVSMHVLEPGEPRRM